MGRQQRIATRSRILEAAVAVFAQMGPYGPVIDDVVKTAGISRGTFYNYFATIDEVREAAVTLTVNQFIAEIDPIVEPIADPVVRFATASRLYLRRARLDAFFAAFVSSVTSVGPELDSNARRDLLQAVDQCLVNVRDVDAALMISLAVNQYGARYFFTHPHGTLHETAFVRSTLIAWGVKEGLTKKALTKRLPRPKRGNLA